MDLTIQTLAGHSKSQDMIIRAFHTPKLKEIWVANGSKFGKCLLLKEKILTINGYTKFGDLKEGDYVFSEHGKPVKVTYVTDTMYDHECYEIVFQDGQKVECDAGHLWFTQTHADRKNAARCKDPSRKYGSVSTTLDILETLHHKNKDQLRPNHSIPLVTSPVEFPKQDLPIDPYVLGVWLGDGWPNKGQIMADSGFDNNVFEKFGQVGYRLELKWDTKSQYECSKLDSDLRQHGFINNPHIPEQYFIGSPAQRLDLVRGLMDTDGTISKKGHCCFDNTNLDLAKGMMRLLMSLGIKCHWHERDGKLYGEVKKRCYRVMFTTDLPVFTVKAKLARLRPVNSKSKNRYIVAVNKIPSQPVKCIKVDNPTSLFLIGEGCIPTHNTIAAVSSVIAKAPLVSNAVFRWIAPIHPQSMIAFRYAQRFLPKTKYIDFNRSDRAIIFNPIFTRWEFRTGKDPENLEGEATAGNVLDECSKMSEQVYASVKTTVTVTRGPIMCISTPRGKNWFYQKCMDAKAEMEWAISKGKTPHRIFLNAPTSDNPYVSPEVIEDARKSLPLRLFKQYFLAEFVDDGNTFANFRKCFYTDPLELPIGVEKWFDPSMPKKTLSDGREVFDCNVIIGADWAKKVDHTVFTAWDWKKKRMVGFWRFQGVNYLQAIKKVYNFGRKFADVELLIHDQTGIGEVIGDLLDKTGFPHQGIVFTQKNKTFMVNTLIISFEQMEIEIPHWIEMVTELDSYEVQTNEIGAMKFSAPSGMHDDIVSSMILGWTAVTDYATSEMSVKIIEELKNHHVPEENWIHNYDDDEGDTEGWETAVTRPRLGD